MDVILIIDVIGVCLFRFVLIDWFVHVWRTRSCYTVKSLLNVKAFLVNICVSMSIMYCSNSMSVCCVLSTYPVFRVICPKFCRY